MRSRYRYRIYLKPQQSQELAKAFGCARVVWNDALALYEAAIVAGEPRPKNVDKIVIIQAKKTPERAWLSEVSNIVLQQSFRDLEQAWSNYFNSLKGKRKGAKIRKPRFKKKQSRQAIRFRVGRSQRPTSSKLSFSNKKPPGALPSLSPNIEIIT